MYDIQEILIDEQTIANKVAELAGRISKDYAGEDLLLVGILKGAVVFLSDLMRGISMPVEIDFIHASSYGKGAVPSGRIRLKKDIEADIRGRHVLLVDCIIDTGETLDYLFRMLSERRPGSLEAAVLLDKKPRRTVEVSLKYRGFEIPDKFVVGYGVDCGEQYRNLPYIAAVRTNPDT